MTTTSTTSTPLIVGLGGTTRPASSSERLLQATLERAKALGADVRMFAAADLDLPSYSPTSDERTGKARALVDALRAADGVVVASPGYHGSISGLVKNALDYIEDLRADEPPYLDGRAMGCIVSAAGWQGAVTALSALRDVAHALRAWPTPLGVAVNTVAEPLPRDGPMAADLRARLEVLAAQVVDHARMRAAYTPAVDTDPAAPV